MTQAPPSSPTPRQPAKDRGTGQFGDEDERCRSPSIGAPRLRSCRRERVARAERLCPQELSAGRPAAPGCGSIPERWRIFIASGHHAPGRYAGLDLRGGRRSRSRPHRRPRQARPGRAVLGRIATASAPLADGGYEGAGQGVHVPFKRPGDGNVLAVDHLAYNALQRGLRARGERGFAH